MVAPKQKISAQGPSPPWSFFQTPWANRLNHSPMIPHSTWDAASILSCAGQASVGPFRRPQLGSGDDQWLHGEERVLVSPETGFRQATHLPWSGSWAAAAQQACCCLDQWAEWWPSTPGNDWSQLSPSVVTTAESKVGGRNRAHHTRKHKTRTGGYCHTPELLGFVWRGYGRNYTSTLIWATAISRNSQQHPLQSEPLNQLNSLHDFEFYIHFNCIYAEGCKKVRDINISEKKACRTRHSMILIK